MEITVAEDVAAEPKLVFDLMADARNEPTWNSQVSRTELTSPEPIGLGTTFLSVNRGQEYAATIAEYSRPQSLTFEVAGKPMAITATMRFTAAGDGTHIEAAFDMQPRGVMTVVLPLMAPLVRRDFPKQFASFKAFCESRPPID